MVAYPGVAQFRKGRTRRDTNWQEQAECRNANPRIFFDKTRYADALIVCGPCPVKEQCRAERRGAGGVWGGKVYEPTKRAGGAA